MQFSYSDADFISEASLARAVKNLQKYRADVAEVLASNNLSKPEIALGYAKHEALHDQLADLQKRYKSARQVLLIGIGGSSLGVEAVHAVLPTNKKLHVLDTIAPYQLAEVIATLTKVKSAKDFVVCIVSKSGGTAETLVNAGVVIRALEEKFGASVQQQVVYVGNPKSNLAALAKRSGAVYVAMPVAVGGRYSIGTEASLVPLAILGHDVDSFISGLLDSSDSEIEAIVAGTAARLYQYIQKGYTHYNFFAFESRLATMGAWYRQLFAESVGKSETISKQPLKKGMVPTISTPVELHSIGQLYLSGFAGVYTDFVTFDDDGVDYQIPKSGLAKSFGRFTTQEVATAIYGGVIGAYQDKQLPFRTTIFTEELSYSLGLFMGMRMREVMYLCALLEVDAFDQPNVESYKIKTKEILGLA